MKKDQIKVFKDLLEDNDFIGKKQLDWLLWRNTTQPKFKVGECFKVSDSGHRVFGTPVVNFNARIDAVQCYVTEKAYRYRLQAIVKHNEINTVVTVFAYEDDLRIVSDTDANEI